MSSPHSDVVIVDDITERSEEAHREATLKWFSELFRTPIDAFVSLDATHDGRYTYEPLTALPDCAWSRPPAGVSVDDGDQDTRL